MHVSPSASHPEQLEKVEKAKINLQEHSLFMWASKIFEESTIGDNFTIASAIAFARQFDSEVLFNELTDDEVGIRRGAVSAAAAAALKLRHGCSSFDLTWARNILQRAIVAPEKPDIFWSSAAVIPWHPAIFVARGLAEDIRSGTAEKAASSQLLSLVAHPLEVVSYAAIQEACLLWPTNSKLTWAALFIAFSICHIHPRTTGMQRGHNEPLHTIDEVNKIVDVAEKNYLNSATWDLLPSPPPAWVKLDQSQAQYGQHYHEGYDDSEAINPREMWTESEIFWNAQYAAKVIKFAPLEYIFSSEAKIQFLDFLCILLAWTNEKNAPPWIKPSRRNRTSSNLFEWTHALGNTLGKVSGLLLVEDVKKLFLDQILLLDGEPCWSLLEPYANSYVCNYIYDAKVVPADAANIVTLCLERLLSAPELDPTSYRRGDLSGFDQPHLAKTLMFVSNEHSPFAARYVNGDWSEINLILPIIDRFVRVAGWSASIMGMFLTLCERAKSTYPSEMFADQILSIIKGVDGDLKGWHGTFLMARIAGLVQHFADRDSRMSPALSQKFLRILDLLVDMGDRRSAGLQLGEAFREVRICI